MQTLRYNQWQMQAEILRRTRQEDEVEHARQPHCPPPVRNTEMPKAKVWKDKRPALYVLFSQLLP